MALSVGDIEAWLRLRDEMSPALKIARDNVNKFAADSKASFSAMGQALGIVTGAVGGIVAAVAALGARGADVADVAGAFDTLVDSAGGGEAAIATLRDATDGLVSNFDLMKSTNLAFSQGLQLSNDQLRLTGEAARVLADQVGGDTKDAYDTLTMAMATGMDRQLKTIGLNIDGAAAVEKYAASLGKEKDALNESEQTAAKRNAILDAMKQKLEESGAAELDFGERITQARVTMTNFIDTLGVAIAQSPVLNAGLAAVGDVIQQAFGANQATTVQTLIGYVEEFAIWLVKAGQTGVEVARFIGDAWFGMQVIFNSIMQGIAEALALVVGGFAKAAAASESFFGQPKSDFTAQLEQDAAALGAMAKSFDDQKQAALDGAAAMGSGLDAVSATLGNVASAMEGARGATVNTSTAAKGLSADLDKTGLSAAEVKKRADELQKGFDALADKMAAVRKAAEDVARAMQDDINDAMADLIGLTGQQEQQLFTWTAAWQDTADKTKVTGDALENFIEMMSTLAQQGDIGAAGLQALNEAMAEMARRQAELMGPGREIFEKQAADAKLAKDALDKEIDGLQDLGGLVNAVGDLFGALGMSSTSAFGQIMEGIEAGISGMIAYAEATNGAQKAMALVQTAAGIVKQGSVMGGAASGAMVGFQVGGPIGAGIGAVAGGLLGLFGSAKKAREEMARLKNEFIDSMGGLDALKETAEAAGVSLEEMFNADSPKEMAAAIDAIKFKLDTLDQFNDLAQQIADVKMEFLTKGVQGLADMFKYATTQAGQTQEGLDRLGAVGFGMFQAMKDSGMSTVEALEAMGPAIDQALEAYAAAGLEASGSFAALMDFRAKVLDNADLVNAVEGWSLAFDALNANGMLSADMFASMDDQLQQYITDLQTQGFTQEQVTAMTLPALFQLYTAQQRYGFVLDETTQAMVDQAAASGAFDDMKDPMAQLVELQELMLQTVAALVTVFGADLPAAVQKYIDALNNVPGLPGAPGGPGGGGGGGGGGNPGGPPYNPYNQNENAAGNWFPYRPGGYSNQTLGEAGDEGIFNKMQLDKMIGRAVTAAQVAQSATLNSSPTIMLDASNIPADLLSTKVVEEIARNNRGELEKLRQKLLGIVS